MPKATPTRVRRRVLAVLAPLACLLASCSGRGEPAEIWTDVPELALYAELYNASQSRHVIEARWKADLALAIRDAKEGPALVVGRYLKSQAVRAKFQSLDYLFGELTVNQAAFYPTLMALGNMEGRQLLLPVSFDIPALVFRKEGAPALPDPFLLDLETLARIAPTFNRRQGPDFQAMGFSPRWSRDFICAAAIAAGAGFREGKPLAWSESGLRSAIEELRSWSIAANGTALAEDDFQFKYLYTPPYTYIQENRALFASMNSAEFFLVPEEKRATLDYRWFARAGAVPVDEDIVYAAIPRSGKDKGAAESFLKWFFAEDSQRAMLEAARATRSLEASFGIAGGFSSVRQVNERVFPAFYPSLVGHLPPPESLAAPNVLPSDWEALKRDVVAPWLLEVTGRPTPSARSPGSELAERLAAWEKQRSAR